MAADSLQPLRVDPALLGNSPAVESRDETAPAPPAQARQMPPASAVVSAPESMPPVTARARAVRESAPSVAATVRSAPESMPPVTATPRPVRSESTQAVMKASIPAAVSTLGMIADGMEPLRVDPALLGTQPALAAEAVRPALPESPRQVKKTSVPPAVPTPGMVADGMEPLRVDPALLGTQPALASQSSPSSSPPEIAEAPAVAPLYSAQVEAGLLPAPHLKSTKAFLPPPGENDGPLPSFLTADTITGKTDVEMRAEGNAELRRYGSVMTGDTLIYRDPTDEVEATGNVHLSRNDDRMSGPHMKLQLGKSTGFFDAPAYSVTRVPLDENGKLAHAAITGRGNAERLDFEGEDHYRLTNATYSTCPAGSGDPDWFARVSDLALDYTDEHGTAHNATIFFKGIPILYSPWMSFALNNQRASGFLSPSLGSTSQGGAEFTIPFYWNIAPNMDATFGARAMAKRGTQWQGEYRYLGVGYNGQISGEYLGQDKIFGKSRDALTIVHAQNFGNGFSGSLNINRVSDDTYFTDLSNRVTNVSQTNLVRQGVLSYGAGWWSASVVAQRYQTLQDPARARVAIPYDRLPQATLTATRPDLPLGLTLNMQGEYVDFSLPYSVPTQAQVEGKRTTLYPQLSLPFQTAAFYVTPKIGFSSTHYELRQQVLGTPDKLTRNVPIMSVDSGLTFERDTDWFGRNLTQTLEPRLYYLRVPFRDQSQIPVFDTGVADFNFAQIFSENVFTGGDRIADANQATVAVTSRFINPDTGAELLKAAIGERYYFTNQNVTLPGVTPRTGHVADFLAALNGTVLPNTSLESGLQYNTRDKRFERYNVGLRYQPEIGKVLNAGYRYNRGLLDQIDVSGQWPLVGAWYGVGRYNYSIRDKRIVESVAGLEYNGSCWVARVVVQRLATAIGRTNSSLFLQLELNGFSQIGSSPLTLLKRNIPGYGRLNMPDTDSEFSTDQYQAP